MAPNSSTRSGAWRPMMAPNTTLPSASFALVLLVCMILGSSLVLGIHHPHREAVQERAEAVQVLPREVIAPGCVRQHALEAGKPLLARPGGDGERQVPRPHHGRSEALLVERRPAEKPDEEGRRSPRGRRHVRGKERAQGGPRELPVEIL